MSRSDCGAQHSVMEPDVDDLLTLDQCLDGFSDEIDDLMDMDALDDLFYPTETEPKSQLQQIEFDETTPHALASMLTSGGSFFECTQDTKDEYDTKGDDAEGDDTEGDYEECVEDEGDKSGSDSSPPPRKVRRLLSPTKFLRQSAVAVVRLHKRKVKTLSASTPPVPLISKEIIPISQGIFPISPGGGVQAFFRGSSTSRASASRTALDDSPRVASVVPPATSSGDVRDNTKTSSILLANTQDTKDEDDTEGDDEECVEDEGDESGSDSSPPPQKVRRHLSPTKLLRQSAVAVVRLHKTKVKTLSASTPPVPLISQGIFPISRGGGVQASFRGSSTSRASASRTALDKPPRVASVAPPTTSSGDVRDKTKTSSILLAHLLRQDRRFSNLAASMKRSRVSRSRIIEQNPGELNTVGPKRLFSPCSKRMMLSQLKARSAARLFSNPHPLPLQMKLPDYCPATNCSRFPLAQEGGGGGGPVTLQSLLSLSNFLNGHQHTLTSGLEHSRTLLRRHTKHCPTIW